MNPVIFIGLAALIITGVSAIHLGLSQQAELSQLHRSLLAASDVRSAAGGIHGEIHEKSHIIIHNPTAHPAHIIQIRAYDADTMRKIDSWQLADAAISITNAAAVAPPYRSVNLTASVMTVPPRMLDFMQNITQYAFRGVSAEGAVFEIAHEKTSDTVHAPEGLLVQTGGLVGGNSTGVGGNGTSHNGTFVGLGSLLVEPDRRTESASGHNDRYAYHAVFDVSRCQERTSLPGRSWTDHWKQYRVYDKPSLITDQNLPHHVTPAAAGDPAYRFYEYVSRGSSVRGIPDCTSSALKHPWNLEQAPGRTDAFRILDKTASWDLQITMPIHGIISAPAGGTLRLYYEIPVEASAAVAYGMPKIIGAECSYRTGSRCGCVQNDIIDAANANALTAEKFTVHTPQIKTLVHFEKNGAPAGTLPSSDLRFAYGGQWLHDSGGVKFADIHPARDAESDVVWTETGTGSRGPEAFCRGDVDVNIRGSHAYSDTIRGDVKFGGILAGDVIEWNGNITLDFAPRIPAAAGGGGTITGTSADMTMGDTLIMVYAEPPAAP